MLMRFDPFRELDRFQELAQQVSSQGRAAAMPMDAYQEGDQFVVRFDLPGVDPSSIDLTVDRNVLTVKAERSWKPSESQQVLINERPQGSFSRQLFLGETLDTQGVQASYDSGVLTLTIPMAEQAKPRKVEVTSGGESTRTIEANASETSSEPKPGEAKARTGDGVRAGSSS